MDRLFRGADAQFLLSLPHGAFHFFVIDVVKQSLSSFMPKKLDIFTDFISSMVSTIVSSPLPPLYVDVNLIALPVP